MSTMAAICDDLEAEHADLDAIVSPLPEDDWHRPTPAARWSVRDQIGHLVFFDRAARLAASDADAFREQARAAAEASEASVDRHLDEARSMSPGELLGWWRTERQHMLSVFRGLDPKQRLPWYGPPMSAMSFATARLMETWAHGQDIVDALGVDRRPTARLRHVAHIGVRARPFTYTNRGLEPPASDVRVELIAPEGELWTWGDEGAPDRIRGSALDFCLVVTQRRHLLDTGLVVEGDAATEWMAIAQAFAGPPGEGRHPGQFAQHA